MRRHVFSALCGGACFGVALAACSGERSDLNAEPANATGGGGAGGLGGTASGGTVSVDVDAGISDSGSEPSWPSDLAPPWLFDDGGGDRSAYKDPTLSDDVASYFTGTEVSSGAPEIVYPLAGALFPNNLLDVEFQWRARGKQVFRLTVMAPDASYRLYFACSLDECRLPIPKSEWFDLGRRYAGHTLSFTLSASTGPGADVASAPPMELAFSPEPVLGALYYWSAGTSELKRATFGSKQPVAFIKPDTPSSDFACVSCHSVSRDGKVLAFAVSEAEGHHGSAIRVAPTADPENPFVRPERGTSPWSALAAQYEGWAAPDEDDPTRYVGPTDQLGNMVGLNADGTLAAVNGFVLEEPGATLRMFFEIRDARSGSSIDRRDYAYLAASGAGELVPIMPEWSPDGTEVVVTLADNEVMEGCIWAWNTCRGSIGVFDVQGGHLMGAPRVIVPFDATSDVGHFYPTWSPDGRYIAFASASGESFDNEQARLRLVRADGGPHACPGPDCWELTRGTRYSASDAASVKGHSTWPKFTPFAQGADDSLFFVSFTSRLPYGFSAEGNDQLWMFGVDTKALAPGADPSTAPIWLPFQDPSDLSLTPYWTESLPCQSDPEGGCQGCVAGESCVVDSANQCQCVADVVR